MPKFHGSKLASNGGLLRRSGGAMRPAGRALAAALVFAAALSASPADAAKNTDATIGTVQHYRTRSSDTFVDLARRFDVGYDELVAANPGVDPWLPGENTPLTLPTAQLLPAAPHRGIVINLAAMRLFFFPPGSAPPVTYPIGIGREGYGTPIGTTRVVRKQENPTWIPTASERAEEPDLPRVVPPGPDNPLGEYALYLGWPGYRIHGTNKPPSVGRRVSHGCIHLYPEDIAALYRNASIGTPVTVVDQPVEFGWIGRALFMEVHPSLSQLDEIDRRGTFSPEAIDGLGREVRAAAGAQWRRIDWNVVLTAAKERRGIPVRITR